MISNIIFKLFFFRYFLVTLNPDDYKLELNKCVKENTGFISNDLLLKFREPNLSVLRNAQYIISTYEKFQQSLEKWIEYLCEQIFESFNLSKLKNYCSALFILFALKSDVKDTLLVPWKNMAKR